MPDYYGGYIAGNRVVFKEFELEKETKCFLFLREISNRNWKKRVAKETMADYGEIFAKTKEEIIERYERSLKVVLHRAQTRLANIEVEVEALRAKAREHELQAQRALNDFRHANFEYLKGKSDE